MQNYAVQALDDLIERLEARPQDVALLASELDRRLAAAEARVGAVPAELRARLEAIRQAEEADPWDDVPV